MMEERIHLPGIRNKARRSAFSSVLGDAGGANIVSRQGREGRKEGRGEGMHPHCIDHVMVSVRKPSGIYGQILSLLSTSGNIIGYSSITNAAVFLSISSEQP